MEQDTAIASSTQLLLSAVCHLWGTFGTADYSRAFIPPHQALHLPVPTQSTNAQPAGTEEQESFFTLRDAASLWLAGAMTEKDADGGTEQDGWQWTEIHRIISNPKVSYVFTKEFWHSCPSGYNQSREQLLENMAGKILKMFV